MRLKLTLALLFVLSPLISASPLLAQQTDALKWARAPEARFPRQYDPMSIEIGVGAPRFAADSSSTRVARFGQTLLPAVGGSYLGFVGGFYTLALIGDSIAGWDGLVYGAIIGEVTGALVGSSIAAYKYGSPDDDASGYRSVAGALFGTVSGLLAMDRGIELPFTRGIRYAIGQGVTTALITAW